MKTENTTATKIKARKNQDVFWDFRIYIILAITCALYIPSLKNYFVNWDDMMYVMNNEMINEFSISNFFKMFSSFFMGNYHPLTIMSFAFDHALFNLNATGYHLHNLLLHLVNTLLVYTFCYHLLKKKNTVALVAALLFGIHPMHVESVAWISERKDLLYTAYFFLSLIFYLKHKEEPGRRMYYVLSIVFFLFSLLSKAQAVTLSLVLPLIDYFFYNEVSRKSIKEKIPFFLFSLFFGILAILAQKSSNSINSVSVTVVQSVFYAQYSLWVYIVKFFFPFFQSALYEYPVSATGTTPFFIFMSPLIIILITLFILTTRKKWKIGTFCILFFILTILPVLQFLPVGEALVAERYTYIPYVGLSIMVAELFFLLRKKTISPSMRSAYLYLGFFLLALSGFLAYDRTKVWKDSESLWSDVIKKNPASVTAYVNRSFIFFENKDYDKTIQDCNDGLNVDPNYFKLYANKAAAYKSKHEYDSAIVNYTKAIAKNPMYYISYLNRGAVYTDDLKNYSLGIADFKVFLNVKPDDPGCNYNMAVAYYQSKKYDSAMIHCMNSLRIKPDDARSNFLAAKLGELQGDFQKAFSFGSKAKQLGFDVRETDLKTWEQKAGNFTGTLKKPR